MTISLVEKAVGSDMDDLHRYVVHHDRTTCRWMNVSCRRVSRIHIIGSGKSLATLDGLGDLIWRPSPLCHSLLPLLGSVIAAELPVWLTWHAAPSSCIEQIRGETLPGGFSPFYPTILEKEARIRPGAALSHRNHYRHAPTPLKLHNYSPGKELRIFIAVVATEGESLHEV